MKTKLIAFLILLICLVAAGNALASSTAASLDWNAFSSGGAPAESSSGNITLNGSLGQTSIGLSTSTQASLWAGFWYGVRKAFTEVFLPLVVRGQ